jgi:biotin-[acetyl-CoA-carboxylase] ligase BirA-like protein
VDSLAPDVVLPRLRGRFGRPYRYVAETPSTQRLLDPAAPEGAVAVADHQTEGRGRLGRRWEAPPGSSVLVSVLLRPPAPPARLPELSVVAAEAVAEAIGAVSGLEPTVKHPNDVLVGGRKLAGILGEARDDAVMLGVGINANVARDALPAETRLPATSILAETGRPLDRSELLVAVLDRLERRYRSWTSQLPGTTALVVAVAEAEALVGGWRREHTPSGADGVPAHVTLLFPFVPASRLSSDGEETVRRVVTAAPRFEFALDAVARFAQVLYLHPCPPEPFAALTEALVACFPDYPPYGGAVDTVVPHLTVAEGDPGALFDRLSSLIEPQLPIRAVANDVQLLERGESGRFGIRAVFPLGEGRVPPALVHC